MFAHYEGFYYRSADLYDDKKYTNFRKFEDFDEVCIGNLTSLYNDLVVLHIGIFGAMVLW